LCENCKICKFASLSAAAWHVCLLPGVQAARSEPLPARMRRARAPPRPRGARITRGA
jgi:hypothetical protein